MRITRVIDPAGLPRRELAACALTHGGRSLTIAVQRGRRILTRTYLVDRPTSGVVQLTREDGEVYTLTDWGCDCRDAQVRGRQRQCKHYTAAVELGLLKPAPAPANPTESEAVGPARGL